MCIRDRAYTDDMLRGIYAAHPDMVKYVEDDLSLIHIFKKLRVRGAPAIGAAAAYGIALLASGIAEDQYDAFYSRFKELKDYLASSRPTAVNLFWALNRMEAAVIANKERGVAAIKELLFEEADRIREEDIQISRGIGEIGFGLLKELKKEGKEIGILTHCNAGTLATAKYGTATAPMYIALEKGWAGTDMHVYCDETRPLLQGARLTSCLLYTSTHTGGQIHQRPAHHRDFRQDPGAQQGGCPGPGSRRLPHQTLWHS